MNTQYKKNLKDAMTACKNYTDKKIDDLKWELGSHTLDVVSDTTTAYTKTVPSGAIGCQINKIGGMSYKYNQLVQNGNDYTTTISGITVTLQNGKYTLSGTATDNIYNIVSQKTISLKANHKYLLVIENQGTTQSNSTWQIYLSNLITAYTTTTRILDITSDGDLYINCAVYNNANVNCSFYQEVIDLTAMGIDTTDVATATSELLKRGIDINQYNEYNTGTIRDTAVTSVVSKGANLLKLVADTSGTVAGVRYNISNGVVTLNGTSTSTEGFWISLNTTVTAGKYYFEIFNPINQGNSTFIRLDNAGTSAVALVRGTSIGTSLTLSEGEFKAFFWIGSSGITFNNLVIYPMLVSGSTAPSEFITYEGTIATTTIPSEVQSLTGYGWGVNDTCYNYIDFENKKFVKKVGRVDVGTLNWSYQKIAGGAYGMVGAVTNIAPPIGSTNLPNLLCSAYTTITPSQAFNGTATGISETGDAHVSVHDTTYTDATTFKTAMSGVYLYYELATPVETDISEYLDDNSIEVEQNGTLTFNNTYEQAVPSDIDYLIEEVKA